MIKPSHTWRGILVIAAIFFACIQYAAAYVNPKFTPVELVNGSDQIWQVKLAPIVNGKIEATITRTLKGKDELKTITLDLTNPHIEPKNLELFEKAMKDRDNANNLCYFFAGPTSDEVPDKDNPMPGSAYLHMDGIWIVFFPQKPGVWELSHFNDDTGMTGTWRGATDMLGRVVENILKDSPVEFPTVENIKWDDIPSSFAKLAGKVNACVPVDLSNDGKMTLFIACDDGDKFYAFDAASKNMQDVTAAHATASKSKVFAWGDFNGDGKLDLASSDGGDVTIYLQNTDGKFEAGPKMNVHNLKVVSLAVTATGNGDKAGLLICTESSLLLWTPQDKNAAAEVISDGAIAKDFGKASQCLVADFDGDSFPDIIQFFEKGAILCKGKSIGKFKAPRAINLAVGSGRCVAFTGDYDADGMLDIVTVSDDACRIWQNYGKFNFTESLHFSGEPDYKATGGAVAGCTCDFNLDSHQDLVLFYSSPMNPQLFFNRGYRSFVFASGLAETVDKSLPKDAQGRQQGQQAGCIADFNGDGAQDMIVILNSGECYFFPMMTADDAVAIRAVLPPKGSYVGPLTVTGWKDNRCLGAWNVIPGCSEALVAWNTSRPLTIKWQFPGGAPQTKTIRLERNQKRVEITPELKD